MSTRIANQFGPLLAAVIFVAIGIGVLVGTARFTSDAALVAHTHDVIAHIDQVQIQLSDAEAAQRGYLLTGRADYLADYRSSVDQVPALMDELSQRVADNPQQQQRVHQLRGLVDHRLRQIERRLSVYQNEGLAAAQATINAETRVTRAALRRQVRRMGEAEHALLQQRARSSRNSALLLQALAVAGIPFGMAFIVVIYRRMLREIRGRSRAEQDATRSNQRLVTSVDELEKNSADLRELSHFASMLQSCMRPDEALQLTVALMTRLLPETGGTVYRIRASQDYAEAMAHWGEHAAPSEAMLPPDDCWALRRGQPHLVHGARGTSRCSHVHAGHAADAASTCIPLIAQGVQLGFLYVSAADDAFIARLRIIEAAAEQLAMALSNLQLQERLRIQSIREPITGLFNRRYLEESLGRELARCERRHLPLALMMLDLDHFKRFNDTHGHAGGDALLAGFGQLLQQLSRPEDIACRYGGEEFTLILPEVTPEAAQARAEAIRIGVEALRVQHLGSDLPQVTVSIGLAWLPEHGNTTETLLRRADEALYRAKREGRNRVALATAKAA